MNLPPRTMMLIDADNVSADVIQQAVDRLLDRFGAIHVRRAYCTADSALVNARLFKRLGIRPIVNLSAGKNSNDIALAVDAIDLAVSERPAVVVIVSSDSDFAPLVLRLREKGCRVEGLGQAGKTGDEVTQVYDHFEELTHHKPARPAPRAPAEAPARAPSRTTSRRGAARPAAKAAPGPAPAPAPAPTPAPTPAEVDDAVVAETPAPAAKRRGGRAGAARTSARAAAKAAPPAPAPEADDERLQPADVVSVLHVLPALRGGERVQLNSTVEPLRLAGLLAKSAASTKLFRKYPEWFELTPEKQPNKVRYLGR